MARVFLSYDREDAGKARLVALALERAGHFVWWDLHIKGGAEYGKVIEQALAEADVVVVLWSTRSVDSAWVRDEAAAGRDSGRLVPVLLEPVNPPMGFRQYQNIDLSRWKGRGKPSQLQDIFAAIDGLVGQSSSQASGPIVRMTTSPIPLSSRLIIVSLLVGAIIAAAYFLVGRAGKSEIRTVAVAAADPSARPLARDLLVKLGSLQAAKADTMRLVEQNQQATRANLIFEVSGSNQPGQTESSLALFSAKDRSLLWSKNFSQSSDNPADLKQQLAYTAALVLDCAMEGLSAGGNRLDQATLKLYLNGCAAYADATGDAIKGLARVFEEVTRKAPKFVGGWAKLLLVEDDIVTSLDFQGETEAIKQALREHIDAARKLNPKLAEANVAEAKLMPQSAILERVRLVEQAIRNDPDNAYVISIYSQYMQLVGRMDEAVRQAQRAANLAPLSPVIRDALIGALAYSGHLDAALEELESAERLWPGASSLAAARYRSHLRYGNPREALRMQPSRRDELEADVRSAFLEARISPTPVNVDRAIAGPRHWFRRYPEAISELAQVLGEFGKEEELFSILLSWRHPDKTDHVTDVLFRPALRNVHRDPRMMAVAKRLGLLAYWQHSGHWPDFCFDADLPYDCKAEAAKLAA